jgi:uncharacterized protein YjbI with pentapeptide repeats
LVKTLTVWFNVNKYDFSIKPIMITDSNYNNILRKDVSLLHDIKIQDFNQWRMKNLTVRPDINGQDFSSKNLSVAYVNGAYCIRTSLSSCNLSKVILAQADLTMANLDGANLNDAFMMDSEMKDVT